MATSDHATEELRTRVRQQEVVADLGHEALETDDLETLLADATHAVAETLEADYCKVLETLPGGDTLLLREGVGWRDGLVGEQTVQADAGSQAGYTLLTREPVVVCDLEAETRFSGPDLLVDHDVTSGISVVIGSLEDPWGVLGVHTTDGREFAEHDVTFVRNVADLLGSAIENERTKRRLRETRGLTEKIVEASPIGITIVGEDGEMEFANDRAEEILGRDRARINELRFDDPEWDEVDSNGDPLAEAELPFSKVLESGEPISDRVSGVLRPDGERVWISVNGVPLRDDRGEIDSVVFTIEDITDRKRLESELEATLERVTDALNAFDTDWNFTYLNDRAKELLGAQDRDLIGKNVWEEFPSAVDSRFEEEYRRAMETQEQITFEEYSPVAEAWLEITLYPSETGLSVYFRDVTERREMETALRESERRFRTLAEHLEAIVWLSGDDPTDFIYVNSAYEDVFGLNRATLYQEGGSWLAAVHPEDHERVRRAYERLPETEFDEEYRIRRPDGECVWIHSRAVPVSGDGGEDTRIVGIDTDVTERKAYQRRLEESNERLEEFAYAASHDLQEPLRMISSYLRLVDGRYADALDEDGREFIQYAVDGADRMQEMIDGLLAYSRVDTRGDPFEPVDCQAVLEDVLADLEMRIEESDAEIEVGALPTVYGDASQLRQVFQNLLSNAIEYSGEGPPRITVRADRSGEEWVLSVEDEGIGIDPEETDRIFEVFNRLHSIEEHPGTGIGLALCQRIVERHDGRIRVDSEPGEGATFSVTLPATPVDNDR